MNGGGPKPMFYVAVIAVVAALVGFAIYRGIDVIAPAPKQEKSQTIDPRELGQKADKIGNLTITTELLAGLLNPPKAE